MIIGMILLNFPLITPFRFYIRKSSVVFNPFQLTDQEKENKKQVTTKHLQAC